MANQNRIQKAFEPNKSSRAVALTNMSDEDIFNRYFIFDDGVAWRVDLNRIKSEITNSGEHKYPKTYSLSLPKNIYSSNPLESKSLLSAMYTIINGKIVEPFTPTGYKFNAQNFVEDLEAILNENPLHSLEALDVSKARMFVVQLSIFFNDTISRGLIHQQSLSNN